MIPLHASYLHQTIDMKAGNLTYEEDALVLEGVNLLSDRTLGVLTFCVVFCLFFSRQPVCDSWNRLVFKQLRIFTASLGKDLRMFHRSCKRTWFLS